MYLDDGPCAVSSSELAVDSSQQVQVTLSIEQGLLLIPKVCVGVSLVLSLAEFVVDTALGQVEVLTGKKNVPTCMMPFKGIMS